MVKYGFKNGRNQYKICRDKRIFETYKTTLDAYKEAARLRNITDSKQLQSELDKKKSHELFIQCKLIGIKNAKIGIVNQRKEIIKRTKAFHQKNQQKQIKKPFSLYRIP